MVWAISDCPGTEQNINIKEGIYNFQKMGVWVQVLSRVALNARKKNGYFYGIYIFVIFNAVSRDQNGPKFNIRSKSLLEPFSKNILSEFVV